jgi:hypothetical protein
MTCPSRRSGYRWGPGESYGGALSPGGGVAPGAPPRLWRAPKRTSFLGCLAAAGGFHLPLPPGRRGRYHRPSTRHQPRSSSSSSLTSRLLCAGLVPARVLWATTPLLRGVINTLNGRYCCRTSSPLPHADGNPDNALAVVGNITLDRSGDQPSCQRRRTGSRHAVVDQ